MSHRFFIILCLWALLPHVYGENVKIIEQTFFPPGKNVQPYQYVSFEVPPKTTSLKVEYSYDKNENTIDIGIFDTRGIGKEGFRGWSGGKRSEFMISQSQATPGYLPGPLYQGEWQVILGLYKIASQGAKVRLKITFNQISPKIDSSFSPWDPRLVLQDKAGWYKGDLHMHSEHSDGKQSISELVKMAEAKGLDFLGFTEHNTSSHHLEIPKHVNDKVLLIMGEEVTTTKGHANVWGLPQGHWVDFRMDRLFDINDTIREVHQVGALFCINHPFAFCSGCPWEFENAQNYDCMEVWNGFWDPTDYLAVDMWASFLRKGKKTVIVGCSDSHEPSFPIGDPTTHVYANNLSQKSILEGIRQGNVYITANPLGPTLDFQAHVASKKPVRMGDTLELRQKTKVNFTIRYQGKGEGKVRVLGKEGEVFSKPASAMNSTEIFSLLVEQDSFFYLEVADGFFMYALSNPIYVELK